MAYNALNGLMKIYRIDGNRCFSEPSKGLSYHLTKELAEKHLTEKGFYLETRKWERIGGHEPNSQNKIWYNKKLSDDGYSFDNTIYCFITEIDVNEGGLKMHEEIKEAMETALRAFENYEKDGCKFYGSTKHLAVQRLRKCLKK
jgi:hypothetical protein